MKYAISRVVGATWFVAALALPAGALAAESAPASKTASGAATTAPKTAAPKAAAPNAKAAVPRNDATQEAIKRYEERRAAARKPPTLLVDINSASRAQLLKLPGIKAADADRIIAGRPYVSKAELVGNKVIPLGTYLMFQKEIVALQKGKTDPTVAREIREGIVPVAAPRAGAAHAGKPTKKVGKAAGNGHAEAAAPKRAAGASADTSGAAKAKK